MEGINTRNIRQVFRQQATLEEDILWEELRNRKLKYKFRRQHKIGGYILDFYCPSLLLAIELDGAPHKLEIVYEKDKVKNEWLIREGVSVMRFWDGQIRKDLSSVIEMIEREINIRA